MTTHWIQQLIVIAAVVVAAGYCAWRWVPQVRTTLMRGLGRAGNPAWLRGLGARLAPTTEGGCDDGCGSCGGCAPKAATQTVQVIRGTGAERVDTARH